MGHAAIESAPRNLLFGLYTLISLKGICQLFFLVGICLPSEFLDKKINTIFLTVRALTRKRQAELAHR